MKPNAEWVLAQLYTTSMHSKMSSAAVLSHGEDIGPMNGHHPRPRTMSTTHLIDVRAHPPQREECLRRDAHLRDRPPVPVEEREPEPADAIPECDRNGSSPKALAAWDAISNKEKRVPFNNAWHRDCHDASASFAPGYTLRTDKFEIIIEGKCVKCGCAANFKDSVP